MRILITAGPTREYLDDVRYLSNASSGRMGYVLAQAAVEAGHEVVLVSGPVALTHSEIRADVSRGNNRGNARHLCPVVSGM